MSREYRAIARINSPYVHIADGEGKPVCGRQYATLDGFFKTVDKDASCKRCLTRYYGLQDAKPEPPQISPERRRYMHALAAWDHYVRLTTVSEEGLNPAELNVHHHKIRGAAISALDALLYTDLYTELRRRAGKED